MIEDIADFLLNNVETKKKCKQITYFPFSYTVKVKRLNFDESKNFIRNKYTKINRRNYVTYGYFSKEFSLC